MKKLCDLHTHSVFSDGTYTPEKIIDSAIDIGLSAVALCDHNTADGLQDFLGAAENKNIKAVAGAEFSVDFDGRELHLLGLFIPEKYFTQISDLMKDVNARKEESNIILIKSLSQVGYQLDYDEIKKSTPNGNFNRAHVAAALIEKGYVESGEEAFATLLSPKAGHYVEPERLTVWQMIDFIKDICAVPVLAHPFLNLSEKELVEFLPIAQKRGLAGMECLYSLYDWETTAKAFALAEKAGLKMSGGSDFHGDNKPDIKLGSGKGNLEIPYEWAEELEKHIYK